MSKRTPSVSSLRTVSAEEAKGYLDAHRGDELAAARRLARDRNRLEGTVDREPDAMEVHHALFLLRRAEGLPAPSFDQLRLDLRRRAA
jgi:hypothetical protein